MSKGLRRIAFVVLSTGVAAVPAYGWGNGGHMAVAYVAYQNLTPQVRDRVDALIKLNPSHQAWMALIPANTPPATQSEMLFMIAATWPDQIKGDHKHQPDGTAGGDRPPDDGTAGQNVGYADVAMHKYWHFIDEPFSQDGTPLHDPPTPNAETQIAAFRATLASDSPDALKSYDLVWLLHLVGDVHQPLHCASRFSHADPDGDNGGNKVAVCAGGKGKAKAGCKGELHAFWDDLFGTSPKPGPAMKVGRSLPAAAADKAGDLDTTHWVQESFDDAAHLVYVNPPIGLGDGPFQITPAYRKAALSLARERVAVAGSRLANVLDKELK